MVSIPGRDVRKPAPPKFLFGLAALLILFVMTAAVIDQWQAPEPEFSLRSGLDPIIDRVTPGSAAQAAGVKTGDLLISVDGSPFDWSSLVTFSQRYKLGEQLQIQVRRNSEVLNFRVPLVTESSQVLPLMVLCLVSVSIWCAAAFLLLLRYYSKYEVRFLFLIGNAFVVSFALAAFQFSNWYPLPAMQAAGSGAAVCLIIPLSLQFFLNFPTRLSTPKRRVLVAWIAGPVGLLLAIAWVLSAAGPGPLWGQYAAGILIVGSFIASCILLWNSSRRASTPIQNRQVHLMILGLAITFLSAVLLFALPKTLFGQQLIPTTAAGFGLQVGLLIFYLSVMGRQLARLDQVINRAVVYAILLLAVFLLLAGPVVYLEQVIPESWFVRASIVAGAMLLVALVFTRIRDEVERWVDHLFYGGSYDYADLVESITRALAHSLSWTQLIEILTQHVPRLMHLSGAWLVLEGDPDPTEGLEGEPTIKVSIQFEGEPYATWIIGQRMDGDEFSISDRRIITTLAPEVDVALSNILLVEKLNDQLEEIRTSHESLIQMGRQLLRSRDDEQSRLSRELHDGPLQELVGMNLQLGILLSKMGVDEAGSSLAEALAAIRRDVRGLMTELREVCAELRPPMLDMLGLSSALRALMEEWSAEENIPVQIDLPPEDSLGFLSSETGLNLYRVAQESLSNVARHAHAHEVCLKLDCSLIDETIDLTIRDDGGGFEPETARDLASQNHFGLVGMQERVALICGELTIESAPGAGTTIHVFWKKPSSPAVPTDLIRRSVTPVQDTAA